ncbi:MULTISPECIES: hypothetical protein [Acinetobacter]|uniref:Scaffolding protein n=1 Tax=Acinetobacter junii TaxID=40215 RepID=A0A365PMC3_ACIJU|nr:MULTISPECIES: hypothetical protein [Acinetobacter]RBA42338.1 hypothetical protein DDF86_00290 [Acinetobacter junii]RBA42908.1 hypothetical protein DDG62_01535 [Acinetobacter junii]RBA49813.1 hypothetical protein DC346_01915 [Acinetobacter junii]WLF73471.1 hypothetical protein Q4617_05530 [Acinetobacter junii]
MSIEDLRTELDEEDNIDPIEDNQEVESQGDPEETQDESNQSDDKTSEDEEFVITVGDEEPEPSDEDDFSGKPAPAWVKDLRKKEREARKRIKELEAQVQQAKPAVKPIEVGPKPKLADFDYDEDQFESAVEQWHERKRQVEQQQAAKQAEEEKAKQAWQNKMQSYEERRQNVASKVRDFEEVEEAAKDKLTATQQGILIHAAENPELILYHLGKNPKKAQELSEITDPIQFAFAAAKLDSQMKIQTRKPSTQPERKPSGSAGLSGVVDQKLAQLEAKAAKTGDRTELIRYKKSLQK